MANQDKNLIFLCILASIHVFGLTHRLGEFVYDAIDLLFMGFVGLFILVYAPKTAGIPIQFRFFTPPIFFLFFSLVVSTFSCWFFHGQSPVLTLLAMRYFFYFFIYFMLIQLSIDKDYIVRVSVLLATCYMLVFLAQILLFPIEIVPLGSVKDFDRGLLRVRVEGVGFLTLTSFYMLNQYVIDKTKILRLCFFFLGTLFIFLLGFRTLLATFLLCSFGVFLLAESSFGKRLWSVCITVMVLVLLYQAPPVQDYISGMIETTQEQTEQGEDYIRVQTFDFLFNQVNVGAGTLFFGNGFPFVGSEYADLVVGVGVNQYGYVTADLGFLGFVFNYGILSLIALFNIYRIAIFKRLPRDSIYLNMFFLYLFLSSFTTAEAYRAGMFGVQMIALYLISYTAWESHSLKLQER